MAEDNVIFEDAVDWAGEITKQEQELNLEKEQVAQLRTQVKDLSETIREKKN